MTNLLSYLIIVVMYLIGNRKQEQNNVNFTIIPFMLSMNVTINKVERKFAQKKKVEREDEG